MWPSLWSKTISQTRILHFHFHRFPLDYIFSDFGSLDVHEPDLDSASPRPSNRRVSWCLLPLAHTGFIRLLDSWVVGSLLSVTKLDLSNGLELSCGSFSSCSSLLANGSQFWVWSQRSGCVYWYLLLAQCCFPLGLHEALSSLCGNKDLYVQGCVSSYKNLLSICGSFCNDVLVSM